MLQCVSALRRGLDVRRVSQVGVFHHFGLAQPVLSVLLFIQARNDSQQGSAKRRYIDATSTFFGVICDLRDGWLRVAHEIYSSLFVDRISVAKSLPQPSLKLLFEIANFVHW